MGDFRTLYGWAEIHPAQPVIAGTYGTFRLTYHVGRYGIDDCGGIKIAVRFASDWGYPQFTCPAAANYCTVSSTGESRLRCRFDLKGHIRPYQKCLVIDVTEWGLAEGDTITVIYGDTEGGSPGTFVQTFREYSFEFRVLVDPFGTGEFVALEDSPELEIIADRASVLRGVAPTQVRVGEDFQAGFKVEDRWGNPAESYVGELRLDPVPGVSGLPETVRVGADDRGCVRLRGLRVSRPGTWVLRATAAGGLKGETNPIQGVTALSGFRPYWGDLHGQSEETVGTNSVEDYFRFARDVAMVDFVAHQGNDFQVTPDLWREINRCSAAYHAPQRFVTFPGYEWSAMTAAGGDHNVYYLHEGEPIYRTSHWQVTEERTSTRRDLPTDCYPVTDLYTHLRRHDALVIPHIGGRPANLAFHDPELEPAIEIYSAWGQFEWLLQEAMERGYTVGFVAGSDDHKGRPGASYPGSASFGVYGGLTCVLAEDLTREAIWRALKARRCYATTGARIALDVRCGDQYMGAEFPCVGAPTLTISAVGTAPIEEIRVYRGLEVIRTFPTVMPRDRCRLRVKWSGALIKGRARIACWDGRLMLDSGRIRSVSPFAFDSAAEVVEQLDARTVSWRSVTSGDEDGVILELEDAATATLHFESALARFQVSLAALGEGVHSVDAGGVDLRVEVEYLPLGLQSRDARVTCTDEDPLPGRHPYYVRLTQTDGARAWSSPLYIHVEDGV